MKHADLHDDQIQKAVIIEGEHKLLTVGKRSRGRTLRENLHCSS